MCVTDKIFDKICLKAIVFLICGLWSEEELETQFFVGGGDIQQKRKFKLLGLHLEVPPLVGHLDVLIRKTLRRVPYCNDFEKSEWMYFLSKQQIYSR